MKFKYSPCLLLSLALAAMPVHVSHAQNAEDPPIQVVEEKAQKETEEAGKLAAAVNQDVDKANEKLEDARRLAEAATGDDKVRALANVQDAEKQLIAARERAGHAKEKVNKDSEKEKSSSKKVARKRYEAPGKPKERESAKERSKEVPKVAGNEPKMEPVTPPDTEKAPEAVVESKKEVKEAKEADQAVDLMTKKVEQEADRRKLKLKDKGDARDLIRDLIGSDSEVSKAEAARETRLEPRSRGNDRQARGIANRDEIRDVSEFLLRQLSGNAKPEEAPAFFRRPAEPDPRREERADRVERRNAPPVLRDQAPPRYYHEGRRYVRFDSRNSIPAILLAAAALDRVRVQPANRTEDYFSNDRGSDYYANELPPEKFRGNDAVVVSYPVSKSSMISSNDIIFAQGSTRFADGHSYDMVMALADAMANPSLKNARFVIEGHASAEGSYEGNMALSQRRAEAIVRDMVRKGIDPERLIPVGYGESEARYPANSPERLRSQDRNVRVFRTGGE